MKTRNFLWGLLACAAFSACSSDEVDSGTKEFKDKAYMKVKIVLAGGGVNSRGTDGGYNETSSTISEYKISDMLFVFYRDNGDYVTTGNIVTPNITPDTDTNQGNNLDATTEAVISLKLRENDEKPTLMVAYANGGEAAVSYFIGKSLNEAKNYSVIPGTYAEDNKFIMTNSTYYDAQNNVVMAVSIPEDSFKLTEGDAENETNAIAIYMERLAAKVIVNEANDLNDYNEMLGGSNGNKIQFDITGFVLNGTNKESYWLKKVGDDWAKEGIPNSDNSTISPDNNVNNQQTGEPWFETTNDYRCFWAQDVNYAESESKVNGLSFYTPAELLTLTLNKNPKYCLENTFPLGNTTYNKFNYATHVLVLGKYKFYKSGNSTAESDDPDVFWYGGNAYLDEDLLKTWANNGGILKKINETTWESAPAAEYALVSDGSIDGVTLEFRGNNSDIYKKDDVDFEGSNTTKIAEINESYKISFKATGYQKGLGYFPVLIEHLVNDSESGYGVTGELGVVRNHIYNLTITSIQNLAEGIFNGESTTEIIPNSEEKTYYLGTTLKILSWKKVNQDVDL